MEWYILGVGFFPVDLCLRFWYTMPVVFQFHFDIISIFYRKINYSLTLNESPS